MIHHKKRRMGVLGALALALTLGLATACSSGGGSASPSSGGGSGSGHVTLTYWKPSSAEGTVTTLNQ